MACPSNFHVVRPVFTGLKIFWNSIRRGIESFVKRFTKGNILKISRKFNQLNWSWKLSDKKRFL